MRYLRTKLVVVVFAVLGTGALMIAIEITAPVPKPTSRRTIASKPVAAAPPPTPRTVYVVKRRYITVPVHGSYGRSSTVTRRSTVSGGSVQVAAPAPAPAPAAPATTTTSASPPPP